MNRLHQLVEDEKSKLSAARVGLWVTLSLAAVTIACDIGLTVAAHAARIPNTVYSLEATLFIAFASWAAGPRIAQYLAPQAGNVASGLAAAVRDPRLPSKNDDERKGGD